MSSESRSCSRNGCAQPAVATLTYVYADSTAVVGPLSGDPEPHSYDLCSEHAQRLTVPRGWEVVRVMPQEPPVPTAEDMVALAAAVRVQGNTAAARHQVPEFVASTRPETGQRRGHLRVLPAPPSGD